MTSCSMHIRSNRNTVTEQTVLTQGQNYENSLCPSRPFTDVSQMSRIHTMSNLTMNFPPEKGIVHFTQ